jgi:hypothetical protein
MTLFGNGRRLAQRISHVIAAHHGIFPTASEAASDQTALHREAPEWGAARHHLVALVAGIGQVPGIPIVDPDLWKNHGALVGLAGLTSVADWVIDDGTLSVFALGGLLTNRTPSRF